MILGLVPALAFATPTPTPPGPPAPSPDPRVFIVGDSVSLGAQAAIAARLGSAGWQVNQTSVQSLHTWQAIPIVDANKAAGGIGGVAFVELGTNDGEDPAQFAFEIDELMQHLQDVHRVYWVNMRLFRDWVPAANAELADATTRWPNMRIVDWYDRSTPDPALVYDDGYHLNPLGQDAMAELFLQTLDAYVQERGATTTTVAVTTLLPTHSTAGAVAQSRFLRARAGGDDLSPWGAGAASAIVIIGGGTILATRAEIRRKRGPSA